MLWNERRCSLHLFYNKGRETSSTLHKKSETSCRFHTTCIEFILKKEHEWGKIVKLDQKWSKVKKIKLTDWRAEDIINSVNSKGAVDDPIRGAIFITCGNLLK